MTFEITPPEGTELPDLLRRDLRKVLERAGIKHKISGGKDSLKLDMKDASEKEQRYILNILVESGYSVFAY